jgi:hypothetical protein
LNAPIFDMFENSAHRPVTSEDLVEWSQACLGTVTINSIRSR